MNTFEKGKKEKQREQEEEKEGEGGEGGGGREGEKKINKRHTYDKKILILHKKKKKAVTNLNLGS